MSSRKEKQRPILYINQPITQYPDVVMQYRYSTRDESVNEAINAANLNAIDSNKDTPITAEVGETNTLEKNVSKEILVDDHFHEETEADANPFSTKRRTQYSFRRVKNFREMSIDEKLIYLENFPEQLRSVSCLYFTENTTYTGILLNNSEDQVEILLPNQSKASIKKSEILDIRMLGLR